MSTQTDRLTQQMIALSVFLLLAISIIITGLGMRSAANIDGATNTSKIDAELGDSSRLLAFDDRSDGAVVVTDVQTQSVISVFPAGEGSFVRGVLRALVHERRKGGGNTENAFVLTRDPNTGLLITDLATGRQLVLNAYGASNVAVFEQLLSANTKTENLKQTKIKDRNA